MGTLHAVVMAGGSGTRFWPVSRQRRPKHLLSLIGRRTLLRQTVDRIAPLVGWQRIWVVTGADHAEGVRRELPELAEQAILVEPCRRDTAPCIGLAATLLAEQDPEAVLVVLSADHRIEPAEALRQDVQTAAGLVTERPGRLATFGIRPTRPATGYGYIERGEPLDGPAGRRCYQVQAFREKPAADLAAQYVASGRFYWNSGIFVWRATTILQELRRQKPEMADRLAAIGGAWHGPQRDEVLRRQYDAIERISIDYAVLEAATDVIVVEASFDWDDVGSWNAVARLGGADQDGNTVIGNHCGLETRNSLIFTDSDHLVATLGVEGLIVVHSDEVTLVADRGQEEAVKQLVEMLRQRGQEQYL